MAVLYGLAMAAVARHVNADDPREPRAQPAQRRAGGRPHRGQCARGAAQPRAARRDRRAPRHRERAARERAQPGRRPAHGPAGQLDLRHRHAPRALVGRDLPHLRRRAGSRAPSCWQLLTRLHSDDRRRVYALLKRAIERGRGLRDRAARRDAGGRAALGARARRARARRLRARRAAARHRARHQRSASARSSSSRASAGSCRRWPPGRRSSDALEQLCRAGGGAVSERAVLGAAAGSRTASTCAMARRPVCRSAFRRAADGIPSRAAVQAPAGPPPTSIAR